MSDTRSTQIFQFVLAAVISCTPLGGCGGGDAAATAPATVGTTPDPAAQDTSTAANPAGSSASSAPAATTDTAATAVQAQAATKVVATTGVVLKNPILFVTQVPTASDMVSRVGAFGNHQAQITLAPRGGDLMIRYPDGTLRNLTREAGFGMDGLQGSNAIAVREPTVHWSGTKALFSMVVGAPVKQYQDVSSRWQVYEVTGLGQKETARITKVANQPDYNNVSPFYSSDDRVLFTSDRPRGGEAHLYPQLDEYESQPTNTGIWSLNPATAELRLLNHTVSGAFSPFVDSAGRIVFTRWDHLQRDQQADAGDQGAVNFVSEAAGAGRTPAPVEVFPEPRLASTSAFGPVNGYTSNLFTPWEMNQDGTSEETLNHIGRHEMMLGNFTRSFSADSALLDYSNTGFTANKKYLRGDGGIFQIRENPLTPGTFFGIYGREFGELGASQIVKFQGARGMNPELMAFTDASDPANAGGRYRHPTPLSDGQMIATHTPSTTITRPDAVEFAIKTLNLNSTTGQYSAGTSITGGISKTLSWYTPDTKVTYTGKLWELEPAEVVPRLRPLAPASPALETPEKSILTEERIDEAALRAWLKTNNLAMIVTRNQTARDRADQQQPYNLQVPGGVRTVGKAGAKVYDIAHYQILQADSVRSYTQYSRTGRRPIALPMHDAADKNAPNPSGPAGSVRIAADGSTAAFVPANRALTWQVTDTTGNAVVRERVWLTFQPGEVRVCASCHGVNKSDQAGQPAPANKPEALRSLLRYWNTLPK